MLQVVCCTTSIWNHCLFQINRFSPLIPANTGWNLALLHFFLAFNLRDLLFWVLILWTVEKLSCFRMSMSKCTKFHQTFRCFSLFLLPIGLSCPFPILFRTDIPPFHGLSSLVRKQFLIFFHSSFLFLLAHRDKWQLKTCIPLLIFTGQNQPSSDLFVAISGFQHGAEKHWTAVQKQERTWQRATTSSACCDCASWNYTPASSNLSWRHLLVGWSQNVTPHSNTYF